MNPVTRAIGELEELRAKLSECKAKLVRTQALLEDTTKERDETRQRLAQVEAEMAEMRERVSRIAEKLQEKESYADLSGEEMLINAITTRALSGQGGRKMLAVVEAAKRYRDDYGSDEDRLKRVGLWKALKDLEG